MIRRKIRAKQFAKTVGISEVALSNILTSKSLPRPTTYRRLLASLEPSTDELLLLNRSGDLQSLSELELRRSGEMKKFQQRADEAVAHFSHQITGIFVRLGIPFRKAPTNTCFDFVLSTNPGIAVVMAYPSTLDLPRSLGQILIDRHLEPSIKAVVVVTGPGGYIYHEATELLDGLRVHIAYESNLRETLMALQRRTGREKP